jgi:hypothetical protein
MCLWEISVCAGETCGTLPYVFKERYSLLSLNPITSAALGGWGADSPCFLTGLSNPWCLVSMWVSWYAPWEFWCFYSFQGSRHYTFSGHTTEKNLRCEKISITTKVAGAEDSVCLPPVDRCCLKGAQCRGNEPFTERVWRYKIYCINVQVVNQLHQLHLRCVVTQDVGVLTELRWPSGSV